MDIDRISIPFATSRPLVSGGSFDTKKVSMFGGIYELHSPDWNSYHLKFISRSPLWVVLEQEPKTRSVQSTSY